MAVVPYNDKSETALKAASDDYEIERLVQNSSLFLKAGNNLQQTTDVNEKETKDTTHPSVLTVAPTEKSLEGKERKPNTPKLDARTLLLILCLTTFEADYPEEFYEIIAKSKLLSEILRNVKPRRVTDAIEEMS